MNQQWFLLLFPPLLFLLGVLLSPILRNVLNMWIVSNWISRIGSTKKHFLPLLRLLLFNILKNDYLSSRIIFRLVLTKKKKTTHFTTKIEPKGFSSQAVSKLVRTPGTLSTLPQGAELVQPRIHLSYCLGMKTLPKQKWKTHQINRIVKWVQHS